MVEEEEIMGKSDPLLLLDNGTLAYILGNGEYRFTNLKFDEAKAIIEMKGEAEEDVVQVFRNPELERVMSLYLLPAYCKSEIENRSKQSKNKEN